MQQINWHLGQAVLPEHFTLSQKFSNQRNVALCEINSATDFYGLAELTIDEHLFEKNIFRIESLTYITPKSECIYYRESSYPKTLELNLNTIDSDTAVIAIKVSDDPLIEDIKSGQNRVQTKLYNISFTINPEEVDELSTFKIAVLNKLGDGQWVLGEYLPMILSTKVYSFRLVSNKLNNLLQTIRSYVQNEKVINSAISAAKLALLNNILYSCNQLQYYILQLAYTKYSPLFIFHAIQNIYLYLLQYQDFVEVDTTLVYKHDKPLDSFQRLITATFEKVLHTKSIEYKAFNLIDNLLSTGVIESEALNRKKHYLVVRKPVEDYNYSLAMIKLTSPSRVEHVYKYAMVGLKLSKLDFNPLPISSVDKYCDVYEILPSREWDYILSEQVICLLNTKEVSELKFVYYYI
ncbi:type VI secretion system baseplate subunit TssK [Francisella sp. SYW-9]|uniref:type VI secretion system baseplate subunit TssK n=1 Tax=Francisella sp. SYW-9 TaxID=2610888 RepID=UPI00123C7A92|nr:type VI secretion system baseplate subunit TssK [Francisella sp. SYW-9]